MAQLLEAGKEESARIRVENIIASDITTELHEIIELYCELLLARIGLLDNNNTGGGAGGSRGECDAGLEEPVKSIIYAAPRLDIKELNNVRGLLLDKFGKEFAVAAMENRDGKVAERVLSRLRVGMPEKELVDSYLEAIAEGFGVEWPKRGRSGAVRRSGGDGENDDDEGGKKVKELEDQLATEELSRVTPPSGEADGGWSPISVAPPKGTTENLSPKIRLPQPPELKANAKMTGAQAKAGDGFRDIVDPRAVNKRAGAGSGYTAKSNVVGGKIPDVNELAARFAALKK